MPYDDGMRRIYLYVNGDLPDDAGKDDLQLKSLLRYINDSTAANATDEITRKLDNIVKSTKLKKDVGIRYMKSWERERAIREEARAEALAEAQAKDQKRIEAAEKRAEAAESKATSAEAELAKYKSKYGDL